jgi:hypothetical protein
MVRKIKIFSVYQDISALELEINDWLAQNPNTRIIEMLQTQSNTTQGWNLIITVLYESR